MRAMRVLVAAVWLLIGATAVTAQVTTGSILGTVTDSSGQVVPGATVNIRDVNKGTSTSFTTDENGSYTAAFLVPGTYQVEIELQGFKRNTSGRTSSSR